MGHKLGGFDGQVRLHEGEGRQGDRVAEDTWRPLRELHNLQAPLGRAGPKPRLLPTVPLLRHRNQVRLGRPLRYSRQDIRPNQGLLD
ncbi:hypothetical protein D1872_279250 [compost metagenome]